MIVENKWRVNSMYLIMAQGFRGLETTVNDKIGFVDRNCTKITGVGLARIEDTVKGFENRNYVFITGETIKTRPITYEDILQIRIGLNKDYNSNKVTLITKIGDSEFIYYTGYNHITLIGFLDNNEKVRVTIPNNTIASLRRILNDAYKNAWNFSIGDNANFEVFCKYAKSVSDDMELAVNVSAYMLQDNFENSSNEIIVYNNRFVCFYSEAGILNRVIYKDLDNNMSEYTGDIDTSLFVETSRYKCSEVYDFMLKNKIARRTDEWGKKFVEFESSVGEVSVSAVFYRSGNFCMEYLDNPVMSYIVTESHAIYDLKIKKTFKYVTKKTAESYSRLYYKKWLMNEYWYLGGY